jgi:hypothetical protein
VSSEPLAPAQPDGDRGLLMTVLVMVLLGAGAMLLMS